MYIYYLLAALGPNYRKYLWWKQHMTNLQMVSVRDDIDFNSKGALENCLCIFSVLFQL